jgi:hypothetical protein
MFPHFIHHPLYQHTTDRTLVQLHCFRSHDCLSTHWINNTPTKTKLLTMDILVLATMKNAAKCDTQCELQNSVNHQNFERILRSEVFLRACLSQWHLPLSPSGFTPIKTRGLRGLRAGQVFFVEGLSLQVQSWPAWRHISNCLCPA